MHKFKCKYLSGLFVSLALLSAPLLAQNPQGMSEEQMQQMMQGMSQMAECFKKIDTSKLEAVAEEAKAAEKQLKQLCADGKRDEAQQQAMAFGMKYIDSAEFKQIKECSVMAKGMMPNMPDYSVFATEDSEDKTSHVCD